MLIRRTQCCTQFKSFGNKTFVPSISMSFQCQCYIIMQMNTQRTLTPKDLNWVLHDWVGSESVYWEAISKTRAACCIRVSKYSKTVKLSTRPMISYFSSSVFSCLKTPMKHSHSFLKQYFKPSFNPQFKADSTCMYHSNIIYTFKRISQDCSGGA